MHVKLCLLFPFGSLVPLSRPHSHIQNAGCSFLQAEGTVEMQVKCFFWRPRAQVPNLASWEPVARQFIGLHARQENIKNNAFCSFWFTWGSPPSSWIWGALATSVFSPPKLQNCLLWWHIWTFGPKWPEVKSSPLAFPFVFHCVALHMFCIKAGAFQLKEAVRYFNTTGKV